MITLCIDVGLRNLSMCIMTKNKDSINHNILLWDVFNVLDSDDYRCESKFKNGKLCNRKCSMKYVNDDNEEIFCCKTHFPKDLLAVKEQETNTSSKNPKNHQKTSHEFKKKSVDEYLLQDIAKAFIQRIQDIYDQNIELFKQIDTVLIELQPKCNPKMLFTSHILYGKLVELYSTPTNVSTTVPTPTIKFVRASQKLKAYTGPAIECPLKGAYAKRKWLSVKYGFWFLENKFSKEQQDIWLPRLTTNKTKKLDDMMDCFLMAINSLSGIPNKKMKQSQLKNKYKN